MGNQLRYVGLGDRVFKISKAESTSQNGILGDKKKVKRVPLKEVKDLEIWSMDRLEI